MWGASPCACPDHPETTDSLLPLFRPLVLCILPPLFPQHSPGLLSGMFFPVSLAVGGGGKSVGEWNVPASSLYLLPHAESQPPASTSVQALGAPGGQCGECLGAGYHGDGACCLDRGGLHAACENLPASWAAWHPRPAPGLRAPGAAALLSLLGAQLCAWHAGALGNERHLWEPTSCSGSDRPGSNPGSTTQGASDLEQVTSVCLEFIELAMGASWGELSEEHRPQHKSCHRPHPAALAGLPRHPGLGPCTPHLSPGGPAGGGVRGQELRRCSQASGVTAGLCHLLRPQCPHL